MLESGWRNKAEKLRVMILSSAHPVACELGPGLRRVLSAFRRVALSGDGRGLQQEIESVPPDVVTPVWEPTEIYGWKINATLYKSEEKLWWLVYANLGSCRSPSDKELGFLDKILAHLGARPRQHAIIEPLSAPPGEPKLSFGWWSWENQAPLLEVQIRQQEKGTKLRVVPMGTPASDGFQALHATPDASAGSPSLEDEIVVEIPISGEAVEEKP